MSQAEAILFQSVKLLHLYIFIKKLVVNLNL